MSDTPYQIPDLSSVEVDEGNLPTARPIHGAIQPGQHVDQEVARVEPNELLRNRREASIRDMVQTNDQIRSNEFKPPVGTADPTAGDMESSFKSTADVEKEVRTPEAAPRPRPQAAPTPAREVKAKEPQKLRDIHELFTMGVVSEDKIVAGFKLNLRTLTAEEYTKAWALASVYPDGVARDTAIKQFLLASSVMRINGHKTEDLCNEKTLTDNLARRSFVFANLDSSLMKEFFDTGFLAVHQKGADIIAQVVKEGPSKTASF
jgi:hypothetical protein